MEIAAPAKIPQRTVAKLLGIAAVSALAYVLDDILHELGHTAAALLLGIKVGTISTVAMRTATVSAGVALAGPLVNFVLGLALLLALVKRLSPAWRYFAWLLGTINLFNATLYLISSSISNSGDWAKVMGAVTTSGLWRTIAGPLGFVLYIATIFASFPVLLRLCSSGVISSSNILRYCAVTYFTGSVVLTVAAIFNPFGPSYILGSGVSVGFGVTAGLWALPPLIARKDPDNAHTTERLYIGWPWVLAGAIATAVFIGVFGPGLRL